jgi:hypothetical protein
VLLILAVAGTAVLSGIANRRVVLPAALVAVTVSVLTGVSNGLHGLPAFDKLQLAAIGVLSAVAISKSGRGAALGAGLFGVTQAIATGLLALPHYDLAVASCDRKCGYFGFLMPGVQSSENALGLALAMAAPFVYLGFRGRPRVWLIAYLSLMVAATGSRSSVLAVLAMLIAIVLAHRSTPIRRFALALGVASLAMVSLVVPLRTTDPYAFSSRGYLWLTAHDRLSEAPWLGFGSQGWAQIRGSGLIGGSAIYSVHNLWMDTLYAGGIICCILLALLLAILVWSAGRAGFPSLVIVLAPALAGGILERTWSFSQANWLVWVLPATILATAQVHLTSTAVSPPDVVAGAEQSPALQSPSNLAANSPSVTALSAS